MVEMGEDIVGRKVRAFSSAIDPGAGVVFEVFAFRPDGSEESDGRGPAAGDGRLPAQA